MRYIKTFDTLFLYGDIYECAKAFFHKINWDDGVFENFAFYINVPCNISDEDFRTGQYMDYVDKVYSCTDVSFLFDYNNGFKIVIGCNNGDGFSSVEIHDKNDYDIFVEKLIDVIGGKFKITEYCIFEITTFYMKD